MIGDGGTPGCKTLQSCSYRSLLLRSKQRLVPGIPGLCLGVHVDWQLPVQLQLLVAPPCRQAGLLQVTGEPGPGCSLGLDAALREAILWTASPQAPVTECEHSGLGVVLSHYLISVTSGCQCGIANVHQDKRTTLWSYHGA